MFASDIVEESVQYEYIGSSALLSPAAGFGEANAANGF